MTPKIILRTLTLLTFMYVKRSRCVPSCFIFNVVWCFSTELENVHDQERYFLMKSFEKSKSSLQVLLPMLQGGRKLLSQFSITQKSEKKTVHIPLVWLKLSDNKEWICANAFSLIFSFQETIDKLSSQVKYFEEKIKRVEESVLSRDYKKHIQDYGSPSQFWEQEIESLHFVIEMKNERIHHLDKKLFNFEKVMEQNLLLEQKVKTLQQKNEELHVQMQLSDEVMKLREALEKESQLREQAHREKEELMYRVLSGWVSPTQGSSQGKQPNSYLRY
uniref:Coiled-coil domain containing 69 n=1 Tax=Anolis carolinensis TaxID=28377 RepID=G1KJQ5_ANOCA